MPRQFIGSTNSRAEPNIQAPRHHLRDRASHRARAMSLTAVNARASEAAVFLEGLFAAKPDDLFILLWTLHDKQSHWFQSVERAIQFAESIGERDLYVGVGLS